MLRLRRFAILTLAAALSVSCAGKTPIVIPSVPTPLEDVTDMNVRAAAIHALGIIESAGELVKLAADAEIVVFKSGLIPQATQNAIAARFEDLSARAIEAIGAIKRGAIDDWAKFKAIVDPILRATEGLITLVRDLRADQTSGWRGLLDGIGRVIGSLTALFPRAPVLEPSPL